MQRYNFEADKLVDNCVGTYLKVIWPTFPTDAFVILYIRPDNHFLFAGYWAGFERSVAVGNWERHESTVRLIGTGNLSLDVFPGPEGGSFERLFAIEETHFAMSLVASSELKGWSLLGWAGSYNYVGQQTVIDPDGNWLPVSLSQVDEWISQSL
jgi:hypothetical protein